VCVNNEIHVPDALSPGEEHPVPVEKLAALVKEPGRALWSQDPLLPETERRLPGLSTHSPVTVLTDRTNSTVRLHYKYQLVTGVRKQFCGQY